MAVTTVFWALVLLALNHVVEAQQCNADNVLRALRRGGEPATSLCYSLILYGVPTVTVVPPPGETPPPVVTTSTSTIVRSVYPDGRRLEELHFPAFVSSYPATRVSSGCSCLLGPHPTTTLTSSGPTITQTTVVTSLSTLSGPCASSTIVGAYSFPTPQPTDQIVLNYDVSLSNAYDCCRRCQDYQYGFCLAYYNVPGTSCNLLAVNRPASEFGFCNHNTDIATVSQNEALYPNQLGGAGPCADQVVVKKA